MNNAELQKIAGKLESVPGIGQPISWYSQLRFFVPYFVKYFKTTVSIFIIFLLITTILLFFTFIKKTWRTPSEVIYDFAFNENAKNETVKQANFPILKDLYTNLDSFIKSSAKPEDEPLIDLLERVPEVEKIIESTLSRRRYLITVVPLCLLFISILLILALLDRLKEVDLAVLDRPTEVDPSQLPLPSNYNRDLIKKWVEWPLHTLLYGSLDYAKAFSNKLPDAISETSKGTCSFNDIAPSLFAILNALCLNVADPLLKISNTYIALVKKEEENKQVTKNVAIVRLGGKINLNFPNKKQPSIEETLVYEGIALKIENGRKTAIYWQTKSLCIDLFALTQSQSIILFRSVSDRIIEFISETARKKTIDNFGEFVLNFCASKKQADIAGKFFDVKSPIDGHNETNGNYEEQRAELYRINKIINDESDVGQLNERFNKLLNETRAANKNLSRMGPTIEYDSDRYIQQLENILTDTHFWSKELPHVQFVEAINQSLKRGK